MNLFSWFNSPEAVDRALISVAIVGAVIEVGVAIVAVINVHKEIEESRKKKLEKYLEIFACVAAFFFMAEAILGWRSSLLLGKELEGLRSDNAKLSILAAQAGKEADKARESAAQAAKAAENAKTDRVAIELQVEQFRQTNLVLQAKVLELEAAVQWRTISPEQEAILIKELKPMNLANPTLRKHVIVRVDDDDPEEQAYAFRIFEVLKECGYDIQFANNAGSLHPRPPIILGVVLQVKSFEMTRTNFAPTFKIYSAFKAAKIERDASEDSTLEGSDVVIRVGRKREK